MPRILSTSERKLESSREAPATGVLDPDEVLDPDLVPAVFELDPMSATLVPMSENKISSICLRYAVRDSADISVGGGSIFTFTSSTVSRFLRRSLFRLDLLRGEDLDDFLTLDDFSDLGDFLDFFPFFATFLTFERSISILFSLPRIS